MGPVLVGWGSEAVHMLTLRHTHPPTHTCAHSLTLAHTLHTLTHIHSLQHTHFFRIWQEAFHISSGLSINQPFISYMDIQKPEVCASRIAVLGNLDPSKTQ